MTTQEAVEKIKRELPHGYQTRIAKKAGVKPSYVSQFLNGHIKNSRILAVVVDEYTDYKTQQNKILKKMEV